MSASVINDQSVVIWKRSAIPALPIFRKSYDHNLDKTTIRKKPVTHDGTMSEELATETAGHDARTGLLVTMPRSGKLLRGRVVTTVDVV